MFTSDGVTCSLVWVGLVGWEYVLVLEVTTLGNGVFGEQFGDLDALQ
jgi:hypothetical protein